MKIITHSEYMENSNKLHHDYYKQFIPIHLKHFILNLYSKEKLVLLHENDKHLNNIPMKIIDRWTLNNKHDLAIINKEINESSSYSMALGCCVFKAACREIILN